MKAASIHTILQRIGSKLSALRVKKGYSTIKEFTTDYRLPLIQYWRIEKGKANFTLKTLLKVLSIHKINLEEFFCLSKGLSAPATVEVNRKKSLKLRR
jgi:transcriptional regulator with XRE-family HTH domain